MVVSFEEREREREREREFGVEFTWEYSEKVSFGS
jgi:hypothetical protein